MLPSAQGGSLLTWPRPAAVALLCAAAAHPLPVSLAASFALRCLRCPGQALEKSPKDADTLANLVACSLHLGKPAARYLTQLKQVAPAHAIVKRSEEGEAAFDRAAASVSA